MDQVYKNMMHLVKTWRHRQSCNNQPEQNELSKTKAHIYGICAEELFNALKDTPEKECTENHELYADKDGPCSVCGKPVNGNF